MVNVNALHKYGILREYTHAAGVAQGVNAVETSPITRFGDDECFQIDKIEIFPPYDADNQIENLLVELIIDGTSVDCVYLDSRMANPYAIGTPPFKNSCLMFGDRNSVDPFENFCLKGKTSLQIRTMGLGPGAAVDEDASYYIRISGDWFKTNDALTSHFGPVFNPEPVTIIDMVRDRRVTVHRPLPINLDNWVNLSGGCFRAAKPRVIPWINFARNVKNTTANTEYALDITPANVQYAWENMHWELDNKTFIINDYVGVWPDEIGKHLRTAWWEYGNVEYPQPFVPPVRWDTRFNFNELPLGMPPHAGILSFHGPRAVDRKLLGTKEIMEAKILDDGTPILHAQRNVVLFAQWSRKIEF